MIEAINIGKTIAAHGVETVVLQHVNLSVAKGEYIAVAGPNGSGKSSLLSILGLLNEPSQGELAFLGRNVRVMTASQRLAMRRGNIGYLQSDALLIDSLTVAENIELPLTYLSFTRKSIRLRVEEVLEKVNLLHRKDAFPYQLTPFQQQLISIARAQVVHPQLVIADEPTNRLNSSETEALMVCIEQSNNEGVTWIVATSSTAQAQRADRTIQLFDGHIITDKLPEKGW
jgi:putative ABC transport system ATP-binding protein